MFLLGDANSGSFWLNPFILLTLIIPHEMVPTTNYITRLFEQADAAATGNVWNLIFR
jgi:hypothetical protein